MELSAIITEAEIAIIRDFKGKANSDAFGVGDVTYAPGTLMFVTFAGAIDMGDRLYHGVYRFAATTDQQLGRMPFAELPNRAHVVENTEQNSEEFSNGI